MFDSTQLMLMGLLLLLIVIGPLKSVWVSPEDDEPRYESRRSDGVLLNSDEEDAFRIQIMRRQHNRIVAAARVATIDSVVPKPPRADLTSKDLSDSTS